MQLTVQSPDTSRLWDAKETARFLGVSIEFLQVDRAGPKRIAFVKIGRAVRYDPADVIAYKDRCKIGGARQASSPA